MKILSAARYEIAVEALREIEQTCSCIIMDQRKSICGCEAAATAIVALKAIGQWRR